MPRASIYWLIADTHFFHDELIKNRYRPENYNELLIRNMCYLIAAQDVLVHLGDVIFYRYPELKGILDGIECRRKFLTMGNHDHKSPMWYMRHGFDGAFESLQIGDVLLSHRPQENWPDGVRVNVHGHWHTNDHRAHERMPWYDPEKYRHLSAEETNYVPVNMVKFAR